jgi:hypothetical protein
MWKGSSRNPVISGIRIRQLTASHDFLPSLPTRTPMMFSLKLKCVMEDKSSHIHFRDTLIRGVRPAVSDVREI